MRPLKRNLRNKMIAFPRGSSGDNVYDQIVVNINQRLGASSGRVEVRLKKIYSLEEYGDKIAEEYTETGWKVTVDNDRGVIYFE